MKKYTVIFRNMNNGRCHVATVLKAANEKEARRIAFDRYFGYRMPNEQLICATAYQYETYWKTAVEKTSELENMEYMQEVLGR